MRTKQPDKLTGVPSPKEYLKIKYTAPTGACKCGDCQLVPSDVLIMWEAQFAFLYEEVRRLKP